MRAFDPLWLDLSDSVEHEQDILIFVERYNASLVAGIKRHPDLQDAMVNTILHASRGM